MRPAYLCAAIVWTGTLLAGPTARADTISFSDSIAPTPTNWSSAVTVPLFDPTLGTLVDVDFTLTQTFDGSMAYENLDDSNISTFTLVLFWNLELYRPDNTLLVSINSLREEIGIVNPFDGSVDFAGPSGVTIGVAATDTAVGAALPPDLTLFAGSGMIDLPVLATAEAFASGGGNSYAATSAVSAADVTVTYTYQTPEPATLAMLAVGGLALRRRRRR